MFVFFFRYYGIITVMAESWLISIVSSRQALFKKIFPLLRNFLAFFPPASWCRLGYVTTSTKPHCRASNHLDVGLFKRCHLLLLCCLCVRLLAGAEGDCLVQPVSTSQNVALTDWIGRFRIQYSATTSGEFSVVFSVNLNNSFSKY